MDDVVRKKVNENKKAKIECDFLARHRGRAGIAQYIFHFRKIYIGSNLRQEPCNNKATIIW